MAQQVDQPSNRAALRRERGPRRGRQAPPPPSASRRTPLIIGGLAVLLVMGGLLWYMFGRDTGGIRGLEVFPAPERGHSSQPQTYAQQPPVGGVHWASWQNCGVYLQPLQNEYAVHSMEHGAVWITYQPTLPAEQIKALQDIAMERAYVLLSPYPNQTSPIALSAWGLQLKVNDPSDDRINRFIATYEQGPQTPELGAACSGGVSAPAGGQ